MTRLLSPSKSMRHQLPEAPPPPSEPPPPPNPPPDPPQEEPNEPDDPDEPDPQSHELGIGATMGPRWRPRRPATPGGFWPPPCEIRRMIKKATIRSITIMPRSTPPDS